MSLYDACKTGDIDAFLRLHVKMLLNNPRIDLYGENNVIYLSLYRSYFYSDIMKILIQDARFDPNKMVNKMTPFYYLCQHKDVELIKYILQNHDDVIIPDEIFSEKVEEVLSKYR